MFEAIQEAVSSWFGSGPQSSSGATGAGAAPPGGSPMATGTPTPEAANALFGGLFGGTDPAIGEAVKAQREAMQVDAAKEKLKDKFNVSKEGGEGMNDVTPEQFDKLAKLYNNIEKGNTDIKFDTSAFGKDKDAAGNAKGMAMEDIAKMMQTPSGRKMLEGLADNQSGEKDKDGNPVHKKTTLKLTDNKFDEPQCQEEGMQAARNANDKEGGDAIEKKSTTPGVGTNAEITYRPGERKELPDGPMATGDTTLFHEMAHAYHMTHGTKEASSETVQTEGKDKGVRKEEHAATGVGAHADDEMTENQYRAERRALGDEDMQPRETYR